MFKKKEYSKILDFVDKKSTKSVKIVAVSKFHPKELIQSAISSGVKVFGENRVQEALLKFENILKEHKDIELHMTGPLQTNKVKTALSLFHVFQTLDRESLAKEFAKFPEIINKKSFFIQINTGKENNKSGVYPELANDFIQYCVFDLKIPILGLMCIPPQQDNPVPHFNLLKKIAFNNNLEGLSMGMSSDYEAGVLCGATHIRVGTKLFGERS